MSGRLSTAPGLLNRCHSLHSGLVQSELRALNSLRNYLSESVQCTRCNVFLTVSTRGITFPFAEVFSAAIQPIMAIYLPLSLPENTEIACAMHMEMANNSLRKHGILITFTTVGDS